jgi:hypothetical protein
MPRRAKPDRPPLPDGFRFGVATSAFQIEGGLNGPGEPANNWVCWEREGRVELSGIAVDFWNRYEEQLDLAAALGCDTFRLGLEWARIEPEEGAIDETALDRYAQILDACVERGLEPLITLNHFTRPGSGSISGSRPNRPSASRPGWSECSRGWPIVAGSGSPSTSRPSSLSAVTSLASNPPDAASPGRRCSRALGTCLPPMFALTG